MATTHIAIATTTVGSGGASSIDFTSIPNTYTDLLVKISARSNTASRSTDCSIRIGNGTVSSSAIYNYREITGDGTSGYSGSGTTDRFNTVMNANTSTSNTFSNVEFYLPNYNSSSNKPLSTNAVIESNENNGAIQVRLQTWLWSSTSAINVIQLFPAAGNFVQYSTATLYGIKNT